MQVAGCKRNMHYALATMINIIASADLFCFLYWQKQYLPRINLICIFYAVQAFDYVDIA